MYMAFYSDAMSPPQITDYLLRVVQPKLQAVPGVAKAELIGNRTFAMRIWLDPGRMAALGITAGEVQQVLRDNNYLAGIGQTKGAQVAIDLSATTDVSRVQDFQDLVLRTAGDTLIRLRDVAVAEMGAADYDTSTWYNGKTAIFIGIKQAPGANPLTVAGRVHELLPELRAQLPSGLEAGIPYDASVFIEDSIREVFSTLIEAVLIVLLVVYLSLGSMRAALIPAVAVPLSLVGGVFLMLLMGFSVNLLTLLAMVLAIGLVVDDAIIVVENVHRHIEQGATPLSAALDGARELALPIIAMTTTLVAVYAPIGFMGGLVGTLFTEFAFALAGAVLISGVVALTLSPMLSSKVLKPYGKQGRFEDWVEHWKGVFEADDVYWCDGTAEEYDRLCQMLVDNGTFERLNDAKRPNSYLALSDPTDVARVEDRTFIACEDEVDAGPTNNWRPPAELKAEMLDLYRGSMRGRTMYVVPFSMGPLGSPIAHIGVQLTDSPSGLVSLRISMCSASQPSSRAMVEAMRRAKHFLPSRALPP
jgi:multidrug efflux pump subunit AcrB